MSTVTFKTQRGADVSISIITERKTLADHNFKSACYDLEISINGGQTKFTNGEVCEMPGAGHVIKCWGANIQIPAESVESVREIIGAFHAEVKRRMDKRFAADAALEAKYAGYRRARKIDGDVD